jgi:hypothetical protein
MRIAAFNGFPFHDEIFGCIINFCRLNQLELTIFCRTENYNTYMDFYKTHFKDYSFEIIDCRLFNFYKYNYDFIFLITDDDDNYQDNDAYINNKTIRIDHTFEIRRDNITKYISVRPFEINNRNWAIPCFPILYSTLKKNILSNNDSVHICILGGNYGQYDVDILNRIQYPNGCKIILHAIARKISFQNFQGINAEKFELHVYENLTTKQMIHILKNSNYIITDVSKEKKYENNMMAGAIPYAFSCLTPLILSKQSNVFYNFQNVIEFDKNSNEEIVLKYINIDSLEYERQKLIDMFQYHVSKIITLDNI